MQIERIADNAINIYISNDDLSSRSLEASSLKQGTHAFNKLIWDAIDHANIEFGHEFEDRQLSIVNKSDGDGGIVLTISHDVDEDYQDELYYNDEDEELIRRFDRILREASKNRSKPESFNSDDEEQYEEEEDDAESEDDGDEDGDEDGEEDEESSDDENENVSAERQSDSSLDMTNVPPEAYHDLFHKINIPNRNRKFTDQHTSGKKHDKPNQPSGKPVSPIQFVQENRKSTLLSDWDVLIFPELNDMLEFLSRNKSFKTISSSLYTYRGAYYLVLKPNARNLNMLNRLETLVIDYNATYLPAESFLPLLKERGILLMERGAISKLISNFEL